MPVRARVVLPEVLDELPPDDRRAHRSRADLRRLHRVMGSAAALAGALRERPHPRRVLELGAGDGTLLLRVGRRLGWRDVDATLLDRVDLLAPETRAGYEELRWRVHVQRRCVLEWAAERHSVPGAGLGAAALARGVLRSDIAVASLFLHHFATDELATLLRAAADRCDAFVAIEPRRSRLAAAGSRLVGVLGANDVTRADAVTSVDAGFAGRELSAAWPAGRGWRLDERAYGPFLHRFVATRAEPVRGR